MKETMYPIFKILLVDDEPAWLRSLSVTLEFSCYINNIIQCEDSREVMGILEKEDVGLILLDLTMPHISGEKLLTMVLDEYPEIAVIIISGLNQVDTAVHAMRLGAFDYFVKVTEEERLIKGIQRAIRMAEMQRENREITSRFFDDTLENPEVFTEIITQDKAMMSNFKYIEAVAKNNQPIIITGESGVGKELFVKVIHDLSQREGALVTVNVAGLDDTLLSDTLFGHARGAFTNAENERQGMIEKASHGTLFLDEIGDLSIASQVKLLRLLQDGEYYSLGSDVAKKMNARIVFATHQDLAAKQAAGEFRKDLFYRLRTHHLHIPPLRQRKEDLPLLLDHFLDQAAIELDKPRPTYPKELLTLLSTYSFPGNIRELKAMVYDALSVHKKRMLSMDVFKRAMGQVSLGDAEERIRENETGKIFNSDEPLPSMKEVKNLLVEEALRRAEGNQSMAARLIGVSQPALNKRMRQNNQS